MPLLFSGVGQGPYIAIHEGFQMVGGPLLCCYSKFFMYLLTSVAICLGGVCIIQLTFLGSLPSDPSLSRLSQIPCWL